MVIGHQCQRHIAKGLSLVVHEPPLPTARLIAHAMGAPLSYLYCEDDKVAALLLALHQMKPAARDRKVAEFLVQIV